MLPFIHCTHAIFTQMNEFAVYSQKSDTQLAVCFECFAQMKCNVNKNSNYNNKNK